MKNIDPIRILRERSQRSTQSRVAQELGISAPYLSDILAGRREPGPKVLAAIGLKRQMVYCTSADKR